MYNRISFLISLQFILIVLGAQSKSHHGSENSCEFRKSDNTNLINKLKIIMEDEDFKRVYKLTKYKDRFELTEKQKSNNATNKSETFLTQDKSVKTFLQGFFDKLKGNQSGEKYQSSDIYSMSRQKEPKESIPRPASEHKQNFYGQNNNALRVHNKVSHNSSALGSVYNSPKVLNYYQYEPQVVPGQLEDNIDYKIVFQSIHPSIAHEPRLQHNDIIKALLENFKTFNRKDHISKQPQQNKNPDEDNFFINPVKKNTNEFIFKRDVLPPLLYNNFNEWLNEYFKNKNGKFKKNRQINEAQPDIKILVTKNMTEHNQSDLNTYDESMNELYGDYETESFDSSNEDKGDSQNSTVILLPENEAKSYLQKINEVIEKYEYSDQNTKDEHKIDDLLVANQIKVDNASDFWQKVQHLFNGLNSTNLHDLLKNIHVNVNVVAVFETYLNGSDHNSNFHVNFNKTNGKTDIDFL